jgi:hypothetical protein
VETTGPTADEAAILADVREDFNRLEAAVSGGRPELARGFVGQELYEELVGTVRDLARRRLRRVHGAFEILDAQVIERRGATALTLPQTQIRVNAISSLVLLGARDEVVEGSEDTMRWTQEVTARPEGASGRWVVSALGPMSIEGPVTGPSGPPLKIRELSELEKRERESEEHARAFVQATLTFLNLQAPAAG